MIPVLDAPEIHTFHLRPEGTERSDLTLFIEGWPHLEIPFRQILAEIVNHLSISVECSLHLPAYEADEDYVSGMLRWGKEAFDIYYEQPLMSLCLRSTDRLALERLWHELSSIALVDRSRIEGRSS